MRILSLCFFFCCLLACGTQKTILDASAKAVSTQSLADDFVHIAPDWAKDKWLYEVNVRQFSEEGTFAGVERHLPRLKQMGIQIIWLMPIHPIGVKNRKGSKGSYYSIKNYREVNPEFGTLADLQSLINTAHTLDMKVMFDWVANHSAYDCNLVSEHKEWYTKGPKGKLVSPVEDWSDVADFNYDKKGLRDYMIESMAYWVETCDIDGYRCDVAGMVPLDFWQKANRRLQSIKPLLMLAEGEEPELLDNAFHMVYGWDLHHTMNAVVKGEQNLEALKTAVDKQQTRYGEDAYVLNFTSNHDENSWNGTTAERMGDAAICFAHFINAIPGMPLIYGGQEAPLRKRLEFFEKDPIDWGAFSYVADYQLMSKVKKEHPAFWLGSHGGSVEWLSTTNDENVLAFLRKTEDQTIVCIFNMSPEQVNVKVDLGDLVGAFAGVTRRENRSLRSGQNWRLEPWDFRMYRKAL